MSLERGPLSEASFAEFGERAVLFCHVTSRVDDDPYQDLLSEKGGPGFPYLVMMDEQGDLLAKHSLMEMPSLDTIGAMIDKSVDFMALKAKADAGDKTAKIEVQLASIEMATSYENGKKAFEAAQKLEGFDAVSKDRLDLEFNSVLEALPRTDNQEELIRTAGKQLVAMREAGKIPEGPMSLSFWGILMSYAELNHDMKMLDGVVAEWMTHLDKDDPQQSRLIEMIQQRVAAAKEAHAGHDHDHDHGDGHEHGEGHEHGKGGK